METKARQFKVSLSDQDSKYLKEIADKLGTNESEVIRKGLQLMALYARTRDSEDNKIYYREGDTDKELLVL